MNDIRVGERPMRGHPARPWLDLDTEIEELPAKVAPYDDPDLRRRDSYITKVGNETTDDN
jgi:hypothetical protein